MNPRLQAVLVVLPVVAAAVWSYGPRIERSGPVTVHAPDTVYMRDTVRVKIGVDTVLYRETLTIGAKNCIQKWSSGVFAHTFSDALFVLRGRIVSQRLGVARKGPVAYYETGTIIYRGPCDFGYNVVTSR